MIDGYCYYSSAARTFIPLHTHTHNLLLCSAAQQHISHIIRHSHIPLYEKKKNMGKLNNALVQSQYVLFCRM